MPKPLSAKCKKALTRAIEDVRAEGFSCWGFLFASDEGEKPGIILEVFNNHDEDPLPVFMVKTQNALTAMRGVIPEEFNLEAQEEAVADAIAGGYAANKKTSKMN